MSIYTLVIDGDCPAIGAETDVLLQIGSKLISSGKIISVQFDDALAQIETLEKRVEELEQKL